MNPVYICTLSELQFFLGTLVGILFPYLKSAAYGVFRKKMKNKWNQLC